MRRIAPLPKNIIIIARIMGILRNYIIMAVKGIIGKVI